MPVDRSQKHRESKDLPSRGDPDRKRVLNVLAQRRYRQKRKEKIAALEAQATNLGNAVAQCQTTSSGTSPDPCLTLGDSGIAEQVLEITSEDDSWDYTMNESLFDIGLGESFNSLPSFPTPLPSTPASQQGLLSNNLNFPLTSDGSTLVVPALSAMRAILTIASALDVTNYLWDPSYLHVLPASMASNTSLPPNLHPVPAQLFVPHHPALDLLPWPSMREKLICMLAMPNELRPLIAQEDNQAGTENRSSGLSSTSPVGQSKAIVQIVQDLDDLQDGGGMRVHGNAVAWAEGNEFFEEAWELGESFYKNWWWCVDQKIVEQSNKRRKERGLGRLKITA